MASNGPDLLGLQAGCTAAGLALVAWAGCSRAYYRRAADAEAYQAVDRAAAAGDVDTACFTIDVDPQSRMFDPDDPDCPPMPPDDPASHQYMNCVDCKKGSLCWRHTERTPFVENPNWLAYLPKDGEGRVVLDLREAVQTALLQSPGYQSQLEELYLSALDVSFERFRFDTQFFGGTSVFFTSDGKDRSGLGTATSQLDVAPLAPGNRLRAQRLTATGAALVVGMANSLVWQFSGPNNYAGATLLDFSIVQPLLREGGRARVLERLTIAERSLLANIRLMERFRRGFYTEIATGRDAGAGPSRRGGFFGGSGLEGFSGVGAGGFGRVGGVGGFAGGAGAAGAGGFVGLLQNMQEIRNQRANVARLRDSTAQLEASHEAGRIDRFQVDLARQALFNTQSRLLTSEAQYQSELDSFKIDLGLPPDMELEIADPLLDRFNLLDPSLTALQEEVANLLTAARLWRPGPARPDTVDPSADDMNALQEDEITHDPALFDTLIAALPPIEEKSQEQRVVAMEDFQRLEAALPKRRATLARLMQRDEVRQGLVDREPFDTARLDARVERLRDELLRLDRLLTESWTALESLAESPPDDPERRRTAIVARLTKLSSELAQLSLTQALARLDAITLDPIELSPQEALEIARSNRRDWMNARASLVDAWRLITFNANDLESGLDVTFSGDLGNVGDNPFDLRDTTGRLRAGLEFDAPLTRLSERNIYRQSLIEYQQARRGYYQFVDRVNQGLRNTLRTVHLNELNFELRREAVLVAVDQVDLTQLRLARPPQPGETSQFGDTTARDLVQALLDLLSVQNDFLSVWVNYEVQRVNLDFDLGTMQLNPDGIWLDRGTASFSSGQSGEDRWCEDDLTEPTEPTEPLELIAPGIEEQTDMGELDMGELELPLELPSPLPDRDEAATDPLFAPPGLDNFSG